MQQPTSSTPSLLLGAVVAIAPSMLGRLLPPNQATQMVFGCLSCLAIVAGGAVAVWHYTKATRTTLAAGEGAKMGLSTGAVALVISTALTLVFWLFAGMPSMGDYMAEQMQRGGQDVPPEQAEMVAAMFSSPGMIAGIIVASVVVMLGAPALGGLLGASIFKKGGDLPPQQTY